MAYRDTARRHSGFERRADSDRVYAIAHTTAHVRRAESDRHDRADRPPDQAPPVAEARTDHTVDAETTLHPQ